MKRVHQRIKHQVQVEHDKGKVPHIDINSNPCNYRVDKNLGYQLGEPGYEVQADKQADVYKDPLPAGSLAGGHVVVGLGAFHSGADFF